MTAAAVSLIMHMAAMVFFITVGTAVRDDPIETSLAWFSLFVGCILTSTGWIIALGWLS